MTTPCITNTMAHSTSIIFQGHLQEAKVHVAMGQQKEAILSYLGCLNCDCRQRPVPYATVSDVVITVVTEAMQLHGNVNTTREQNRIHANKSISSEFISSLFLFDISINTNNKIYQAVCNTKPSPLPPPPPDTL